MAAATSKGVARGGCLLDDPGPTEASLAGGVVAVTAGVVEAAARVDEASEDQKVTSLDERSPYRPRSWYEGIVNTKDRQSEITAGSSTHFQIAPF